jgi:D-galactarolactone isomerase
MAAGDTRRVADAKVSDYRELQKRLGTSRVVVVQPSTYGIDNRCMLDALREFGSTARGIAVVDTTVGDDELQRLDQSRVCGIRFNLARAGATTIEMMEPLAERILPLGWHLQLHMTPDQIVSCKDVLNRLAVPMVFDHMGRIPPEVGEDHPAFRIITRLGQEERAWVKLSGPYLFAQGGFAQFDEVVPLTRALARDIPDRLVWGSDWPHPGAGQRIVESWLAASLSQWIVDDRVHDAVLLDNPARLYGFDGGC